jgi:hypothetical protein
MATNRAMLKEAIADAKAVKETAIANAKAALEEAFAPQVREMLSLKLQEMEEEDGMKNEMYGMSEDEKMYETEDKDKMNEVDLEELLAELENEEPLEENLFEAEEDEESEEGKEDEEDEGEPVDMDMTDEELKDIIEDVLDELIKQGKVEAGPKFESDEEDEEGEDMKMSDDEELDLAELLREIEEMETPVDEMEKPVNELDSSFFMDADGVASTAQAIAAMATAVGGVGLGALATWWRNKAKSGKPVSKSEIASATKDLMKDSPSVDESELAEAYSTIKSLKNELNEINLLNAKLLYSNKIFKAKNLNESQKVKVLSSFDKATTVGEVKMVFETLNEGIKVAKTTIKENLGSASKATSTPTVKKPIVESNEAFLRMQKLAGLI